MELAAIILSFLFAPSFARDEFEGCSRLGTFGYEYVKLYPIDVLEQKASINPSETFVFEFYVRAASDAHILLAENKVAYTPAYEIVIGGGKNSFSQIRLFQKEPRTSQPTPNVISPLQYRGFWIKLQSQQIIMVGRKGEKEPFLFWVNNQPFKIRYFAFSTWNNVKGEWYFNCKDYFSTNPEFIEGEGNLTATQKLKNDLFTFYNPTVIPQREGYPDETIEVYLDTNYIHLDEKRGELTLSGTAAVKWIDWKLVWNPDEYEGIKNLYVNPYQLWTPSIRVMNSLAAEKKYLFTNTGNIVVTNKGEISWRVPFNSVTLCVLGYKNWPFDAHNCTLVFGFWTEPLKINIKDMKVSKVLNSEWKILKTKGQELLISHMDDLGGIVDIYFQRRDPSYEFLLLPPFLGAAVLMLSTFWLYPKSPAKLFLNCGSILILFFILMGIGGRVATVVSVTPKIVLLYSWSLLFMCIPILLFVGLKYVPPYVFLPRVVSTVLNSSFIEILFLLPENPQKIMCYSHIREERERWVSATRIITFIERFVFLIYAIAMIIPFLCFLTRFEWLNL